MRGSQTSGDHRLDASRLAVGLEHGDQRGQIRDRRRVRSCARADGGHRRADVHGASLQDPTDAVRRPRTGTTVDRGERLLDGSGRRRLETAAISSSLSAKMRKIVPSAIPAASAICRVVTISPCSMSKGSVASMIIDRRSPGGSAAARLGTGTSSGRPVGVTASDGT